MKKQIKNLNNWLETWEVTAQRSVFSWKKTKEILSADLFRNLQRALSPKDNIFLDSNDKRLYIVVDRNKLPENFVKLFELDLNSPDVEDQVKSLFQRARLLDPNSHSARIVFVDDKVVVFRNEEKLVHKEIKNLTQWEKKRSEVVTTFNTFSNIYDSIRSQYHIIHGSEDRQDDCKRHQQALLKLAQEVKLLWIKNVKDWEWKRKIDEIIKETENAKNFRVLAANLQNLQSLTLKNSSIDSNLLEWAKNKFKNRFSDLQDILGVVNRQLNGLENILVEHENLLEMFLSQLAFTDRNMALDNYQKWYKSLKNKYWDISPFSVFFDWINKYKSDEVISHKFILAISRLLKDYKKEHKKKLSWKDVEFEWFDEVKDSLKSMEELILKSNLE